MIMVSDRSFVVCSSSRRKVTSDFRCSINSALSLSFRNASSSFRNVSEVSEKCSEVSETSSSWSFIESYSIFQVFPDLWALISFRCIRWSIVLGATPSNSAASLVDKYFFVFILVINDRVSDRFPKLSETRLL